MKLRPYSKEDPVLTRLRAEVDSMGIRLTMMWPNALESVWIYKLDLLQEQPLDLEQPYRIYTREEYASFNGYWDKQNKRGLFRYQFYPCVKENGEEYLLSDELHETIIDVVTSKLKIAYEIQERRRLFHPRKIVQMNVFCEEAIPSCYLCYVKKRVSVPVSIEDGMRFEFISDFEQGENRLPEIEIDKDEYIGVYLTDQVLHPEIYQVVRK